MRLSRVHGRNEVKDRRPARGKSVEKLAHALLVWEVAVIAHALQRFGVLKAIEERVRFVRARMGKYELIDFVAMLIGYAVSGERTLQAFCERVQPFADPFMALFGRADLPNPATLSRYLAVLDQPCVEALRTLFLEDLLARSPFGTTPGGL
jgi:hypothetical protein